MINTNTQPTSTGIDAIILCGGKGTRFLPVSKDIPKVMADIHGRPFLDILIEQLLLYKIQKIILCLGYMAEYIKNYYKKSPYQDHIVYSEEPSPLGTGGAIKNAKAHILTDLFVAINGDSFCDCPIHQVIDFHKSRPDALITVVLTKADDRRDAGNVLINKDFVIQHFLEKSSLNEKQRKNAYVNAGIYIFHKKILKDIPDQQIFSLEYNLFPQYTQRGAYGFIHDSDLIDIGTPERYNKALEFFKNKYAQ